MPPIYVDGVLQDQIYVDGVKMDTVYVDGVQVYAGFSPVPGVRLAPGEYLSTGWNNQFNHSYTLVVDADGTTTWAQMQTGSVNKLKAPTPSGMITEVSGSWGDNLITQSPSADFGGGMGQVAFQQAPTGPRCQCMIRNVQLSWSPPLTWSDATGFTIERVQTGSYSDGSYMYLQRNPLNFFQYRLNGSGSTGGGPSAWITCTPP